MCVCVCLCVFVCVFLCVRTHCRAVCCMDVSGFPVHNGRPLLYLPVATVYESFFIPYPPPPSPLSLTSPPPPTSPPTSPPLYPLPSSPSHPPPPPLSLTPPIYPLPLPPPVGGTGICGDYVVNTGEMCDAGLLGDRCCSQSCQLVKNASCR